MNNIPMIFIRPDRHQSAGTIVKKRNNSELYFLPARIRKMKTKKWYILNLSLIFLFLLNYVLYIPIINLPNAVYIYPLATIIISLIGILLYIKMTYNYKDIEKDLIYIGNNTESLKNYFENLFINEEIKFFYYNTKLYYRGRRAIFINDKFITNISGSVNSKLKFNSMIFIGFSFSLLCFIFFVYRAITIKIITDIVLLPVASTLITIHLTAILTSFKGRLSQQIELLNFLVNKYGKKENEK